MPPVAVAFVGVVLVFLAFWATAGSSGGTKWAVRIGSLVVAYALTAVLSSDGAAAAVAGQYLVYLGAPAVVVYWVAKTVVARGR